MITPKVTPHFSEILQNSENTAVIIFKHSNNCGASSDIEDMLKNGLKLEKIINPVYIVTVQDMPVLSRKIEEYFNIKHETPQIIIVNKGKVTYSKSHRSINIEDFVY